MNGQELLDMLRAWLGPGGGEDGISHVSGDGEITGITVCWMPTLATIGQAAALKHNLMITHEDYHFPPDYAGSFSPSRAGRLDVKRRDLLDANGITVMRIHTPLDRLCVLDDIGARLHLGRPVVCREFYRVYEVFPLNLGQFAEKVRRDIGLAHVRVSGQDSRPVRRIGNLWGGMSLSINGTFVDEMLRFGIDTALAGELDEYSMRAFVDLEVGAVEMGHEAGEEIGLRHFAALLQERLPDIPVEYAANLEAWRPK